MSYKTELQSNNVDLQGILDKVNALPEMEEAPELPTLSNPAAAAQILSGYEVLDQHGIKLTGIMEDNGAVSQALNAGGSYTIPAGYHNGSGKVTGNSLASQTSATAAAADIYEGKTAWVNGVKVTGTNKLKEGTYIGSIKDKYNNAWNFTTLAYEPIFGTFNSNNSTFTGNFVSGTTYRIKIAGYDDVIGYGYYESTYTPYLNYCFFSNKSVSTTTRTHTYEIYTL